MLNICCITSFVLFNEYIWIYLLESNNLNECLNILKRRKKVLNECLNIFTFKKIYEYLGKWIYSPINIQIYSNIQIFATLPYGPSLAKKYLKVQGWTFDGFPHELDGEAGGGQARFLIGLQFWCTKWKTIDWKIWRALCSSGCLSLLLLLSHWQQFWCYSDLWRCSSYPTFLYREDWQ